MPVCDVVVVGAGVIGGAVAYELARRGAAVTLLEARGAGSGSTQAAAGMLVPFVEGFGRPLLPLAARSLDMYDAFVEKVARDADRGVGYRRTGSLHVIAADEPAGELATIAEQARAAGVACDVLDAHAARNAEPHLTPEVAGALYISPHGFVVPGDLSGALTVAAIKHGARMRVPACVRHVVARDGGVEVEFDGERLSARHAVIAAGSWSGRIRIDGAAPLPIRPIRGQLLQLGSTDTPLRQIVWGSRCYLVPSAPGTILVGATVEDAGFDERTTAAGVRDLLEAACDLVPRLWQATFVGARAGLRPATPDEMPIIGRSHCVDGLVYATGHYRNGILLAPLTAQAVADLVLENREDPLLAHASPQRFGEC